MERLVVLAIFVLFEPGHLDCFQLALARLLGVAAKASKFGDKLVQVCKAYAERILLGKFLGELDANLFCIVPIECLRHDLSFSITTN
jgi:hypothetical protein